MNVKRGTAHLFSKTLAEINLCSNHLKTEGAKHMADLLKQNAM